ncbi:MAG: TerC family protein [Buchnera aphidicola (Eriosoma harunire)]
MEFFLHTSTLAGLFTLIILEVVLGVDNLVFISILTEKLPPYERDKARILGVILALLMRISLLLLMSWMITLVTPIIKYKYINLSAKDLILLLGGLFLLFKSTIELHERLENHQHKEIDNKNYANFWPVVIQIVVLDAVFSLDSIITAISMVNSLSIMIIAVIIATMIMLLSSKPLTTFMHAHPTVVVLCLSFLLIIGLSLVAESIGFNIQKGYLYTAVGFSIIIELFNQIARHNFIKNQSKRPMRQRVAETIFRLMNKEKQHYNELNINTKNNSSYAREQSPSYTFKEEEKYMITGVLTLAARSIRSIMTPRGAISWVNIEKTKEEIRTQLLDTPHSLFPICKGELDEIIGIIRAKELLIVLEQNIDLLHFASKTPAIIVPDTLDSINLLSVLKKSKGSLVIVTNEFSVIQGLITPLDLLEAIAGEFPDADETPEVIIEKNSWLVKGSTDLHSLQQLLNIENLINTTNYASVAGLLIAQKGQLPKPGDIIFISSLSFQILEADEYRIDLVRVKKEK